MATKNRAAAVAAIKGLLSETWADGYEAGRRAGGCGGGAVNPFEGGCRWCASVEGCFCDGDGNPPVERDEGVLTALDGLTEAEATEVRRQASELRMSQWADAQSAYEWRRKKQAGDEAYWLSWGYPYAQQGRIANEIMDAIDSGGHDDPLIDRACALMGEDDAEDLWDAYVIAADGMTPCPEHSDPECHLCEPLDAPRGVWLAPGQKRAAVVA